MIGRSSGVEISGRMIAGDGAVSAGSGLFWHWVSGTRCQFGGDKLGVTVEEQNGQRTGDAPDPD